MIGRNVFAVDVRDMEGHGAAFALNQSGDSVLLRRRLVSAVARLAADVGLVNLDNLVLTAERA
jgi:hypothetical protein